MNQQELDIKTEEKALTNVSDFRFAPIKGQRSYPKFGS